MRRFLEFEDYNPFVLWNSPKDKAISLCSQGCPERGIHIGREWVRTRLYDGTVLGIGRTVPARGAISRGAGLPAPDMFAPPSTSGHHAVTPVTPVISVAAVVHFLPLPALKCTWA